MRALLNNGIKGPRNGHFVQLEHVFHRYRVNILWLSEVKWWESANNPPHLVTLCYRTPESLPEVNVNPVNYLWQLRNTPSSLGNQFGTDY